MPDPNTLAAQLAECKALLATMAAERDAARAENARLREALEKITEECKDNIDCTHQDADDGSDDCTNIDDCAGCTITALARAALSADPGEWWEGQKIAEFDRGWRAALAEVAAAIEGDWRSTHKGERWTIHLEEKLRQTARAAQIEVLEAQPCSDTDAQRGKSCIECRTALLCPRCKALVALKGGRG